jgi:putative SOS response-associated peptidase YedK
VEDHFGLEARPDIAPRYNVAPSKLVPVIAPKQDPAKRGLALLKWGLVPDWSNDGKAGPINARAETVAGLPTFADSFRGRRCIIPATGFYEWRGTRGRRVPFRFHRSDGGLLGFAGLWSVWAGGDGPRLFTACIITTAANDLVQPYHDRMPAILRPEDYTKWFDADAPLPELHALLKPFPVEMMAVTEANVLANSARNEGPGLLDPAA